MVLSDLPAIGNRASTAAAAARRAAIIAQVTGYIDRPHPLTTHAIAHRMGVSTRTALRYLEWARAARGETPVKVGARFEHTRYVQSTPHNPTGVRPDVCTVTSIQNDHVYYLTETGARCKTPRNAFPSVVGRWL